jgi:monoamine oxidase
MCGRIIQHLESIARQTMPRFSRRSILAASAAFAARHVLPIGNPVWAATPPTSGPVDAAIIGAGTAGIAAARKIAAAGHRYVLIEATDHIGGRCVTDMTTFGVPYDRGAHWLYLPDSNPLTKLAPNRGDIYPAPRSQKVRIGRRFAREGELEDFLSAQVRATRAIDDIARKTDTSCEQAMPADLGDWKPTVEFMLGPYNCAKDLSAVSSFDFAKETERKTSAFAKPGLGALLASLAQGLNVQLSTQATSIDTRGGVSVITPKGTINARTAIVTVPTNVISSGGLKFTPDLEHHQFDAFGRMSLGSYDHIALELPGNPLGLDSDDLVFEKSNDNRTAAILANISGTPLCVIDVAGSFGRDLSAQGEAAMFAFAGDWLASLYGAEIKNAIGRKHATRWNSNPYALGAWSAAVPGSQFARRQLLGPITANVWYAGEAAHETLWGTVGGAWESGERAADLALRQMGGLRPATPVTSDTDADTTQDKRKTNRAKAERRAPRYGADTQRYYSGPSSYGGTPNIMGTER